MNLIPVTFKDLRRGERFAWTDKNGDVIIAKRLFEPEVGTDWSPYYRVEVPEVPVDFPIFVKVENSGLIGDAYLSIASNVYDYESLDRFIDRITLMRSEMREHPEWREWK